jgi:hypothetical protein
MSGIKPWYKSKGVWGSILTLVVAFSGLPIAFDTASGDFTINVYQLGLSLATVATGGLSLWGRMAAKVALK